MKSLLFKAAFSVFILAFGLATRAENLPKAKCNELFTAKAQGQTLLTELASGYLALEEMTNENDKISAAALREQLTIKAEELRGTEPHDKFYQRLDEEIQAQRARLASLQASENEIRTNQNQEETQALIEYRPAKEYGLPDSWNFLDVHMTPNGDNLLVATPSGYDVFDAKFGTYLDSTKVSNGGLSRRALFSNDQSRALFVLGNNLLLWNVQANKKIKSATIPDGTNIAHTSFSQDNRYIGILGTDRSLWVWDSTKNKTTKYPTSKKQKRNGPDGILGRVQFHPNSKFLAVSNSQAVAIVDLKSHEVTREWRGLTNVFDIQFSPDGNHLAIGHAEGVQFIDLATFETIQIFKGHRLGVASIYFSPNSKFMTSIGLTNNVIVRNLSTLSVVAKAGATSTDTNPSHFPTYTADSSRVLITTPSSFQVWDLESKTKIFEFPLEKDRALRNLHLSGDGKRIVLSYMNGIVKTWQATQ